MPRVTDADGDGYSIAVYNDAATSFTDYKDGVFSFTPTNSTIGTYIITITLTDTNINPLSMTY